jgi:protein disulfide-isomerase-like protein
MLILLASAAAFLFLAASPANAATSSGVVETLTDANFESKISSGVHFVKFYAPWCGHCKKLAPVWTKAAAELAKVETNEIAHISEVDCTVSRDVCTSAGIRGYPTLQLYANGDSKNPVKYSGARETAAIVDFVKQHAS